MKIKTQLIIYLGCFALFLVIKDKDIAFLFATLVTVISALVSETLICYLKNKTWQITESSVITGFIIGFVVSSDEAWWKLIFVSALAILSKYLICSQKKHIFNPAAFGIFLSTVLLGVSTQWKGTYIWYIVVPFGLYFTYAIKKIEIIVGYMVTSLLLFGVVSISQKIPLWNIFGYFSFFYIFVMVIEPKTTPVKKAGKYLFGIFTALLIFILTEIGARFDVELFSLLAINSVVLLLNRLLPSKGGSV